MNEIGLTSAPANSTDGLDTVENELSVKSPRADKSNSAMLNESKKDKPGDSKPHPKQATPGYMVDLDMFQGPMELLLYLIRKEELDLHDIPIARITKQYLEYVEVIQSLNLEAAGEFILMAATLIRIKTKMLLPRDESDPEENDPREELVAALLEYKRFSEASEGLRNFRIDEETVFVPAGKTNGLPKLKAADQVPGNTLFQLISAFREVMERSKETITHVTGSESIKIEDRIKHIIEILKDHDGALFSELFLDIQTRLALVVTFLAILEMTNARRITISQTAAFTELRIYRGEQFSDESAIIVDEWEGNPDHAKAFSIVKKEKISEDPDQLSLVEIAPGDTADNTTEERND